MSVERLERWEELACDAALVGLDEAERAELAALAVDEAELVALERAAGEVAAVALNAVAALDRSGDLPARLAARILEQIEVPRAEVLPLRARGTADREQRVASAPRPIAALLPWGLAAAAVVLAVIGWTRSGPREVVSNRPVPSASPVAAKVDAGRQLAAERAELLALPGTASLPWKPTEDAVARGASGEVTWHNGVQRGFMRFRGLAANDAKKEQYQLWIFDAERDEAFPVDGGVFDVGPDGEVLVPIEAKLHVGKPKLFAVTVERPGGVVVSKRERIVLVAAPSG